MVAKSLLLCRLFAGCRNWGHSPAVVPGLLHCDGFLLQSMLSSTHTDFSSCDTRLSSCDTFLAACRARGIFLVDCGITPKAPASARRICCMFFFSLGYMCVPPLSFRLPHQVICYFVAKSKRDLTF